MASLNIFGLSVIFFCSFFAHQTSAVEFCEPGTKLRVCDDNSIYLLCSTTRKYIIQECKKGYIFKGGDCFSTSNKRCGLPCDNKKREICDNDHDEDDDDNDGNVIEHNYYPFYYKCEPVDKIRRYTLTYCPDGEVFREGIQQCRPRGEKAEDDEDSDDDCSDISEDDDDDDNEIDDD